MWSKAFVINNQRLSDHLEILRVLGDLRQQARIKLYDHHHYYTAGIETVTGHEPCAPWPQRREVSPSANSCSTYPAGSSQMLCLSCVKYIVALSMGLCRPARQGLNPELLKRLTFSTPWKEFRVESRKEASVCKAKLAGEVFRYIFSGAVFWTWFLYLFMPRKALTSFVVMSVPCDQWNLLQKRCAWLHKLSLHQKHLYWP